MSQINIALNNYFSLQHEIFKHFDYTENWRVIPLDDCREVYWRLYGQGPGRVRFADTAELLDDPALNYYEDEIYTHRFLKKWVYRANTCTLVCVDTHTDGNKLLRIFDNAKERKAK